MLGIGLLALGALALGVILVFIRYLFRTEVRAYIDRVAELERRIAITRSEKRRLEHEAEGLRRQLELFDDGIETRAARNVTSFPPDPHQGSS